MDTPRLLITVAILALAFSALHGLDISAPEADESDVAVETCESLPDYDHERMVSRVERIKGMELRRNVTICTEQAAGGIDVTADSGRFMSVGEQGLALFGLDPTTDSQGRSSLGHTSTPIHGGPIEIFVANETVTGNVSYTSYEGIVAHELSHAIDNSHLDLNADSSETGLGVRRTTDWLLANQAVSEGSATYVSERYVRRYGGELNVSKLGNDGRSWRHRIRISPYKAGYDYSRSSDVTSTNERRVNSTARILHPDRSDDPGTFPARANLSTESLDHVRTDRVGELFLRETFVSKGVESERAAAAADGWTNDRMDYYRANGSTVVSWRVTWRNASERAEFVETYDAVYDYERVDALRSVDCGEPGRYLGTSEKAMTVLQCSD